MSTLIPVVTDWKTTQSRGLVTCLEERWAGGAKLPSMPIFRENRQHWETIIQVPLLSNWGLPSNKSPNEGKEQLACTLLGILITLVLLGSMGTDSASFSAWIRERNIQRISVDNFHGILKYICKALARCLSRLEHRPVYQKAVGLIPSQGTYLGWSFDPQ